MGAAAGAFTAAMPSVLRAQQYPSQDVHLICALPAGSAADITVRWTAEQLRPLMKRTIIVENKVGAGGNIATGYVARSKPDGHTILINGASAVAANMHLIKDSPVDAGKEIQVAATMNRQPTMLLVRADAPWKTVAELTAFLREKGDKATYGISNPLGKVMGAIYKAHEKLEAVEVQYRTGNDALNDFSSGVLDYGLFDNGFGTAQARAGRMRILAVSTPHRMQAIPDIPTMTEAGIPMGITGWYAAMVPAATPRPIVDQINAMFTQAMGGEVARLRFLDTSSDSWVSTPDEAQAMFQQEIKDWADYVRLAKIDPQG